MTCGPLAIIGFGCRLPGGVVDGRSFWKLLTEGRDAVSEIPGDRWSMAAFATSLPGVRGKTLSRWGGFLEQIDRFEPECFGISPREADYVDPQQRLLLETAWEALEMAGLPIDRLAGSRTGVFVGISTVDYAELQRSSQSLRGLSAFTAHGSTFSIAANRLSYCLDLRGPSFSVDTACSSSLVALDRAVKSLRDGESDLALAGGVNVILGPEPYVSFSRASMLSPDGRCKAFDAAANGFVRGEGAGVLVLKRLDDALRDGDPVQAVLLGSGVNQDGRTGGLSMPNPEAQAGLLREVYAEAGIDPEEIACVEAHGTGTAIGDPSEAAAIGQVFAPGRGAGSPVLLGSVKANIGHLEAASGMASVIKAILMLRHRRIPASLHFRTPNPHIRFDEWRLRVPVQLEPWPDERPATVGINSFGFGGTNAHVVVREYVEAREPAPPKRRAAIPLVLSARTPEALAELASSWVEYLIESEKEGRSLSDIAFSAATRRSHAKHRLGMAVTGFADARDKLGGFLRGRHESSLHSGQRPHQPPEIAFAFSGQGPQWHGMGRELLASEPVFAASMQACDRLLGGETGWSLLEELGRDEESSRMGLTEVAQPALFALQVSLAALWQAWGIRPAVVLGHSVGEIAAAHVAGLLTLAEAARLVAHRGRSLQQHALPGRMLAAAMTGEEAAAFADERVTIAAVNASRMVTFAGDPDSIAHLDGKLTQAGIWCQELRVRHAFHSPLVEPAREAFLGSIGEIRPGPPRCAMISTVTGADTGGRPLTADYWWDNVRAAVRFRDAIDEVARRRAGLVVVEVGPHPVLSAAIRQDHVDLPVVASLVRGEPEAPAMVSSLTGLFVRGATVHWSSFWPQGGRCVQLPSHPWTRQRYWHETAESRRARLPVSPHPLLGHELTGARRAWQTHLDRVEHPWISDHRAGGQIVFPASGLVEMLGAAATRLLGCAGWILDDVLIKRGLFLNSESAPELETVADPSSVSLAIASRTGGEGGEWFEHCQATCRALAASGHGTAAPCLAVPGIQEMRLDLGDFYADLEKTGLDYGPSFRVVRQAWQRGEAVLALVESAAGDDELDSAWLIHPTLLDGCLQALLLAVPAEIRRQARMFLPERIDQVRFHRAPGNRAWSEVRVSSATELRITADVAVYTGTGELAMELSGFACRALPATRDREEGSQSLYAVAWHHRPLPEASPIAAALSLDDSLASMVARADARASDVWLDRPIASVEASLDLRDRLARHYMLAALEDLCGAPGAGATVHLDGLVGSGRVQETFRAMLAGCLESLRLSGHARRAANGQWIITPSRESAPFVATWRLALAKDPESYPDLRLIELCGRSLVDVWAGRMDPLAVLSEREALGLLEQIQSDGPWVRYANRVMQQLLEELVRLHPGRPLRILELGGGTGATTRSLLQVLPAQRTEYWFTDVSQLLVSRAEQKFGSGFVRTCRLDPERDLEEQGVPAGSFDVVVAGDVLHTVTDVRGAVLRCASALCEGGLLLLRESTQSRPSLDLVHGFTEGWRSCARDPSRPEGPLLGAADWKALLAGAGLETPTEAPACESIRFGTVIAARRTAGRATDAPSEPVDGPKERMWLVFTDAAGLGVRLAQKLRARGCRCVVVGWGAEFQQIDADTFRVDPASAEDQVRLHREIDLPAGESLGVAYLASADLTVSADDEDDLGDTMTAAITPLLHFLQTFAPSSTAVLSRIFLVTRGAQVMEDNGWLDRFPQSAFIGIGRVAASEFPTVQIRMVDVEPESPGEGELFGELLTGDSQEEVAWRGGRRFVPRLEALDTTVAPGPKDTPIPWEMSLERTGDLERIGPREITGRPPGPGEVRVEVRYAALNFRDVLKALGMYPADDTRATALGDECSGIVREVGSGVSHLVQGDRVALVGLGCFRSEVTLAAAQVVRIPGSIGLAAASAMPVAFITADYALREVARLRRGESVLIHSAASGVGMASLQIARAVGARVFATAGSPAKRELVARLGAEVVMDSRGLGFADEVRRATSGRGVDVVVNSLAGQAMERSLGLLAPRGRFVELGQRDYLENRRIGLAPLRNNVSYHAVALGGILDQRPGEAARRLSRVFRDAVAGRITPLPCRIVPASRLAEALRLMGQGSHQGKLVLEMSQPGRIRAAPRPLRPRSDRTYLITGAFGGVGRALASLLAERGAGHLVLIGRSGASTEAAAKHVEALTSAGVQVLARAVDVADRDALAGLLREIDGALPPLAGVFHLAMVLDDVTIANLDSRRLARVIRPKVQGAWNLHRLTRDRSLDHFVLFGSAAAAIGNVGQANYSAANMALEALAGRRRAEGLPAATIAWGLLGEAGQAAERFELQESLRKIGIQPLTMSEMWRGLDAVIHAPSAVTFVFKTDWRRLTGKLAATGRSPGILAVQAERNPGDLACASTDGLVASIASAAPAARLDLARSFTLGKVATVLGASASALDREQPLAELGLDSLMAVELVHSIEADLGISLPFMALPRDMTVEILSARLVQIITGETAAGRSGPAESVSQRQAAPRLIHLAGDPLLPAVYCIHPIGGDLAVYQGLAGGLAAGCSVYGIESRLLAGAHEEYQSLSTMADAYVELIRARDPAGPPVRLVGFSMGGMIALEMARILESRDIPVAFVALIECHASYVPATQQVERTAAVLEALITHLQPGVSLDRDDSIELGRRLVDRHADGAAVVGEWMLARGVGRADGARDILEAYLRRVIVHLRLCTEERRLEWCAAPLLVWNAEDGLVGGTGTRAGLGHGSDAGRRAAECTLLPTDHFGILAPPHSLAIAQRLVRLATSPEWLAAMLRGAAPRRGEPAGAG